MIFTDSPLEHHRKVGHILSLSTADSEKSGSLTEKSTTLTTYSLYWFIKCCRKIYFSTTYERKIKPREGKTIRPKGLKMIETEFTIECQFDDI